MSKQSEMTIALKETQALQVMALILEGKTQAAACKSIGISPSTYRRYLQEYPGTVDAVRELILNTEKSNLAEIVSARTNLVTRLIAAASQADDISEIISADKHLGALQAELETRVGVSAKSDDVAEEWLGNPEFKPVESRFIPVDTTVNLKQQSDGSIDVTMKRQPEIIEGESKDSDD